ncbi:Rv1893 family protein [Mycobacterium sp. ML4]
MAFDPKDAVDAVRDIATNAVEKASDIVEHASDILRGDIAGGASGIVQNSIEIGTHAVDRVKEVFTGKDDDDLD